MQNMSTNFQDRMFPLLMAFLLNESLEEQMFLLNVFIDEWGEINEEEATTLSVLYHKAHHIKIPNYFEEWLFERYLDQDFFSLFRMTKKTFEKLVIALNCKNKPFLGGAYPIPIEKGLLLTLWWLGKGEVLLSVADKFNIGISTVYRYTEHFLDQLLNIKNKYIVWPDKEEAIKVEMDFRARSGYPGVLGAIDVCNIKIKAPLQQQESYIDKNNNHSIKLQAVVSANKIFTNINVGFPGSAHDSRVFQNSELYLESEMGNYRKYFYADNFHLVGDKAYPLLNWIMTPYKDHRNLTAHQLRHNTCHSKTRIVVEHSFGLLKSRWRILQQINVNSIQKAIKIIAACCILHNFCFINLDFWNTYESVQYDMENNDAGNRNINANQKRDEIASLL